MRIPKIKNTFKQETGEIEIVKLFNFTKTTYQGLNINDPKELLKLVRNIERLIRQSMEYKKYITYLKEELNITHCSFLPQVDVLEVRGVGLEFHHYPFTLFDIVNIIINHYKETNYRSEISPFLIAEEAMECHYENIIGLIPLSKTVHELAHSGEIFIPLTSVFGNVREFLRRYESGLTSEMREQLMILIELTNKKGKDYDPKILNKKIRHYEVTEFGEIKKIVIHEKNLA